MDGVITMAPTGPVATTADNPNLPTQPEEIARAVESAYRLGAAVAHLHFRDPDERPTADLEIARRTVDLVRERCPILVQVSTGVGPAAPFEERARLVELAPEMATLNPCSMSFGRVTFDNPPEGVDRLAARMMELGVKPELELYDTGHLDAALRLRDRGLVPPQLQVSVVLGVAGGMAPTVANLVTMVDRLPEGTVWQVVAVGRANLALTAAAAAMGGNVRAGMEDTLHLRKGELAPSNDALVARAVEVLAALDRSPASVDEARARILGTPAEVVA